MITIAGLTARQVVLCDILWACDETDDVFDFIATLKGKDKTDALSLMSIMLEDIVEQDNDPEWQDAYTPTIDLIKKIKGL